MTHETATASDSSSEAIRVIATMRVSGEERLSDILAKFNSERLYVGAGVCDDIDPAIRTPAA